MAGVVLAISELGYSCVMPSRNGGPLLAARLLLRVLDREGAFATNNLVRSSGLAGSARPDDSVEWSIWVDYSLNPRGGVFDSRLRHGGVVRGHPPVRGNDRTTGRFTARGRDQSGVCAPPQAGRGGLRRSSMIP